jgi:hypothetical protein
VNAEWKVLGAEVQSRLRQTLDPPRCLYFVFVVVGIGGLGAWRSAPDMVLLRANLATYAIGISAAAAVELVLGDSTTRALRMLAISIGIVACAASLLYLQIGLVNIVWLAAVCAWLLWMLSSSSNLNLGSPNPVAATGGDTQTVAGDLSGFQT